MNSDSKLRRPSASMAVSLLALTISIAGGTAYAAGAIDSADIANGQVKTADLGKDAVTLKKLADNAVSGAKIADGSVTGADVGDGSLTGAKVADGSLTGADVADGSLGGADLAGNSIGGNQVNEASLGTVPDSAALGGVAAGQYGRVFATGTTVISGTISAGDNYQLASTAVVAPSTGICNVSVSGQISGTLPSTLGPYFRAAEQVGAGAPVTDGTYGHYFNNVGNNFSTDVTRTVVFLVAAGTPVKFGGYYGSPGTGWVGANATSNISWTCLTAPPSLTLSSSFAGHAVDAASAAQNRAPHYRDALINPGRRQTPPRRHAGGVAVAR